MQCNVVYNLIFFSIIKYFSVFSLFLGPAMWILIGRNVMLWFVLNNNFYRFIHYGVIKCLCFPANTTYLNRNFSIYQAIFTHINAIIIIVIETISNFNEKTVLEHSVTVDVFPFPVARGKTKFNFPGNFLKPRIWQK